MCLGKSFDETLSAHLEVSAALRDDLDALLKADTSTPVARRNLLRATGATFEGFVFTLADIVRSLLPFKKMPLSRKQELLLKEERRVKTIVRIKESFKLSFTILELPRPPVFAGPAWTAVRATIQRRHGLMHPTSLSDLDINDDALHECVESIKWLLIWGTEFLTQAQERWVRN